jgi:hypothetical protein
MYGTLSIDEMQQEAERRLQESIFLMIRHRSEVWISELNYFNQLVPCLISSLT